MPAQRFGPKAIVTVSAASLFVTVAGSAAFAYQHYNGAINTAADGNLTKDRPAAAAANAQGQTPENILLVGSDSRDNGNNAFGGGKTGNGARSDTSILLHIYADHKHAVGISIPRDMMVDIPACLYDQSKPDGKKSAPQHNQFNAAFAVGDTAQGNIICERDTIEQMSGIRVDHTVVVGFAAFANLTTDIGGVAGLRAGRRQRRQRRQHHPEEGHPESSRARPRWTTCASARAWATARTSAAPGASRRSWAR